MSPELQRIAIAEACGWTKHRRSDASKCGTDIPAGEAMLWEYVFVPPQFNGNPDFWRVVPRYTSDLNAMHEAEKVLTEDQWYDYAAHLTHDIAGPYSYVRATAAQRAEAFLKTIGKWITS